MKAKVLLTGEIVDVEFFEQRGTAMTNVYVEIGVGRTFYEYELQFLKEERIENIQIYDEEKHWQDVRGRAAIAAMQAYVIRNTMMSKQQVAKCSVEYADALVEELKEGK